VPTGRSIPKLGALLPGARLALPDVGGNVGNAESRSDGARLGWTPIRHFRSMDDAHGIEGDGSVQSYLTRRCSRKSVTRPVHHAEVSAGDVRANMIPKDGGNQLKGSCFFSGANQGCSRTQRRGLVRRPGRTGQPETVWDFNGRRVGRFRRDRLWFFTAYRDWGVLSVHRQQLLQDRAQTVDDSQHPERDGALTAQITPKNKFAVYLDRIRKSAGTKNRRRPARDRR